MNYRIISDSENQLCNRFFAYLDSVSWAIRYNKHVYILFWNENIKYFDILRSNKYVSFPFYFVEKRRWLKAIYCRIIDGRLANKFYFSSLGHKFGFFSGWANRGLTDNLLEDKTELRRIFLPNNDIRHKVNSLFEEYRVGRSLIVGVHIRRGDYKTFIGGRFYYENSVYEQRMAEIVELCKDRDICFYLASNEDIPESLTKKFKSFSIPKANTAEDLYALSKCDILLGPPSTFTGWASYLNDIPIYYIYDKNKTIKSLDYFSPLKDAGHYADGRELLVQQMYDEYEYQLKSSFSKR